MDLSTTDKLIIRTALKEFKNNLSTQDVLTRMACANIIDRINRDIKK